jgi:hypothetical protein
MRRDRRAIDQHLGRRTSRRSEGMEDAGPHVLRGPAHETVIERLTWAVDRRRVDPPSARLQHMHDARDHTAVTLAAGVDTTPIFQGLEGNQCQSPHWGFVLRGQITTTDAAGKQKTVTANDLFYWPPGHNVRLDADAEIIMFSPSTSTIASSTT